MKRLLLAACFGFGAAATVTPPAADDPYTWLEDVQGEKAIAWVKAENARSLDVLQKDPRYQTFYDQALTIEEAPDRIPAPVQQAGAITNFWQDAAHVRGLWRRTSQDDYFNPAPAWRTMLDVDALAAAEKQNWIWKGAACLEPGETRCMISLSDGGEDAVVAREFDIDTPGFVSGGFSLPRAKMGLDWESADALLVATDWGPGTMTASGYPFVVKRVRRGAALTAAREVFRGQASDVLVNPTVLVDGQGHRLALVQEGLDFFRSAWFRIDGNRALRLDLPEKMDVAGLLDNRLIMLLRQDWSWRGSAALKAGSIVAMDMGQADAAPVAVFVPDAKQSVDALSVTKDRVIASILDNVRGRIVSFAAAGEGWTATKLALPDNATTGLVSSTIANNQVFVSVTGFLQPSSLWFADLDAGTVRMVKQAPARFDASRDVVEQFEATSKDGTRVPYFVVRPKDLKLDGTAPTLLYAYGGFAVSEVPSYSGVLGKLWLERGGVYVLANIRGGGEFGPAWHEAAQKTHRQRAYDDFAAVAQDLIARKITSPRRLGIEGGSNGGLLMGVEFEQHPELWNATVIQVPLLDMLRFEHIAAGASWVGEYGSVTNPEERAFLAGISPYANLRAGVKYPMPFIYTTTKDDRVGPQHARKFAAKMKELGLPFLYYEAIEGGHSAGANAREKAEEQALTMVYLSRQLMD